MKTVLLLTVLLSGSAAMAQDSSYPPCSSKVMDKCTETGMTMHKGKHSKAMARHKRMHKPMAKPAAAATPAQ